MSEAEPVSPPVNSMAPSIMAAAIACDIGGAAGLRDLTRHPLLPFARPLRWRSESLTWLEGDDLPADTALERHRRFAARLVPLLPGDAPLLPGMEPGAEAAPDGPARPFAALVARRMTTRAGEVDATLLSGRLRCVSGEAPVQLLTLFGPLPACLDLAARLARDVPLLPAAASLAERARALADDRAVRPRRSAAPSLAGVGTVGEAFMAAGAHLLDVLLAETPRCRLEAGPRGVHQSRVALRRLRSVVRVFRPAFDGPALRAWDRELGALARALGAARDWDVFLDGVGRSLAAAFPEDARATGLLAAAEGARAEAYAALGRTLAAPEFRALVWEGAKLLADPPRAEARPDRPAVEPDGPLTPFAAAVLRKRWKRLRAAGDQMGDLPAEALHEMRLDVKRLRYAAELFAPLFGGRHGRRLLRRLAALQDALGLANDAAVARGLAAQLPDPDPFAAGLVAGLSVGRAADSRDLALGHWQKTLKTKLFWK